jgi:DNA polymerase-1
MMNWPKRAELEMQKIFGGEAPPSIRTIIVPSPGHVFIEADFTQAELFVLAALSGDSTMWKELTTPGRDMHDRTTIDSFSLEMFHAPTSARVTLNDFEAVARRGGKNALKAFQSDIVYVSAKGERMSREEFKNGPRVAGKGVNFGVPYGRKAYSLAVQVKAETGTDRSVDELAADAEIMLKAWKTVSYPTAWDYMMHCASRVASPERTVLSPWGRVRVFPKTSNKSLLNSMEREAQNFPIQSTVADTALLAFYLIRRERKRRGMRFRIVNQVHDSIMLEVPEDEVDDAKALMQETMGSIRIPMPEGKPLVLGIEIDVLDRWKIPGDD